MSAQAPASGTSERMDAEADICYICLEAGGKLAKPCACPRVVHERCLARWQLQQAGKSEERNCRFCGSTLPDWKDALTPASRLLGDGNAGQQPIADSPLTIRLGGKLHRFRARQGPEGEQEFRQQVRNILRAEGYPEDTTFEVTYDVKVPCGADSKETIKIQGMSSYEAAVHCAMISSHQSRCSITSDSAKPSTAGL